MPKVHKTICFVIPYGYGLFSPASGLVFGGGEVQLYLLARELAKNSSYRIVALVGKRLSDPVVEQIGGVILIKAFSFGARSSGLISGLSFLRALMRTKADIYQLKGPGGVFTLPTYLAAKLKRARMVTVLTNDPQTKASYLKDAPLRYRFSHRWQLCSADALIAQHQSQLEGVRNDYGVRGVRVIPSLVKVPEVYPETTRRFILWVGRPDKNKQPEVFFELARLLPQEKFLMVLAASREKTQKNLLTRASSISNLSLEFKTPYEQMSGLYRKAKLLVNTSSSEGFPNVFVEAWAQGAPVFSLNVNPAGAFDHQRIGLFADGDRGRLASAIERITSRPKLLEEMSRASYRYVKSRHGPEKVVGAYEALYRSLLRY